MFIKVTSRQNSTHQIDSRLDILGVGDGFEIGLEKLAQRISERLHDGRIHLDKAPFENGQEIGGGRHEEEDNGAQLDSTAPATALGGAVDLAGLADDLDLGIPIEEPSHGEPRDGRVVAEKNANVARHDVSDGPFLEISIPRQERSISLLHHQYTGLRALKDRKKV